MKKNYIKVMERLVRCSSWWVSDSSLSYLICPPKTTFHMMDSKMYNKDVLFQIWCNRDYIQRSLQVKAGNWHIFDWCKQVRDLW